MTYTVTLNDAALVWAGALIAALLLAVIVTQVVTLKRAKRPVKQEFRVAQAMIRGERVYRTESRKNGGPWTPISGVLYKSPGPAQELVEQLRREGKAAHAEWTQYGA